jgi:hypothetical protein
MNPRPDPAAVREIFDAIADRPSFERRQYLDAHCSDPELRQRVDRLLAADAKVNSVEVRAASISTSAFPSADRAPRESFDFPALPGYWSLVV